MKLTNIRLNDYPIKTYDKIRYRDMDRQGHVNNAVFSSFLETGRVELIYNSSNQIISTNSSFVIASLNLDFISELKWPGKVDIGTGIIKIGTSSIIIIQGLYQDEKLAATAETIIVQTNKKTGSSKPLSPKAKEILEILIMTYKNIILIKN